MKGIEIFGSAAGDAFPCMKAVVGHENRAELADCYAVFTADDVDIVQVGALFGDEDRFPLGGGAQRTQEKEN